MLQQFTLAPEYLEDPTLLIRPLLSALMEGTRNDRLSFVLRSGAVEEYYFHRSDLLFLGDHLRELVAVSDLEAVLLQGYCDHTDTALLHFPSRSFYGAGDGTALGGLFVQVAPAAEAAPVFDQEAVLLWHTRYPRAIELS